MRCPRNQTDVRRLFGTLLLAWLIDRATQVILKVTQGAYPVRLSLTLISSVTLMAGVQKRINAVRKATDTTMNTDLLITVFIIGLPESLTFDCFLYITKNIGKDNVNLAYNLLLYYE